MEAQKRTQLEALARGQTTRKDCVLFLDPIKGVVGVRIQTDEFLKDVTWQVPLKDIMELVGKTL